MKIYVDLRDKGSPDYFMADENAVQDLSCSCDISQLNEMVCFYNNIFIYIYFVTFMTYNT